MRWELVKPDPKNRVTDWHVVQVVRERNDDDENVDIEIIAFHPDCCPVSFEYHPGTVNYTGDRIMSPSYALHYQCGLANEVENNGWSGYFGDDPPKAGWYRVRAELIKISHPMMPAEYDVEFECVRMEDGGDPT